MFLTRAVLAVLVGRSYSSAVAVVVVCVLAAFAPMLVVLALAWTLVFREPFTSRSSMLSGRGWCWFVVVVGAAIILAGAGICAGGVRADGVVVWLTYCAALVSNRILCNLILTYRYQPLIASLI